MREHLSKEMHIINERMLHYELLIKIVLVRLWLLLVICMLAM